MRREYGLNAQNGPRLRLLAESCHVDEFSGSLDIGQLCAKESLAKYISPCSYCGAPADSIDHIPPRHMRMQLREMELTPFTVMEVPSCRECNSALGARPLLTIGHRRSWIKGWLKRRYAKYLRIPNWTEEELATFGPGLRGVVIRNMAKRDLIKQRIQWPNNH